MFEITVTRLKDGQRAVAQASHAQALRDHLEASAARNGFEIVERVEFSWEYGAVVGDVLKNDKVVAIWEIGEIK